MKLISYLVNSEQHVGLINNDGVVDLNKRLQVKGIKDLLERQLLTAVRDLAWQAPTDYRLRDIELLPTIPDPTHIFCVGTNYRAHLSEVQAAGVARPEPQHPSLFVRYPETLAAHGGCLLMPSVSDQFDYEAELAVIIGREGRSIPEAEALDYVAGYTCFNDGSIRDWQFHSAQVTAGKNFLSSGALGPWMVTHDVVPDPLNLEIVCRINGEVMQKSRTSNMIFSIPRIISYVSSMLPLKPGDVIATGTPEGVGFSRRPPRFMQVGDAVEVDIEQIGLLGNVVRRA